MKYQVGDRVMVYGNFDVHPGDPQTCLFLRGSEGTVTSVINPTHELLVKLDIPYFFGEPSPESAVHPKQCRKLRRKLRTLSVHKEVWKSWKKSIGKQAESTDKEKHPENYINFKEEQ